MRLLARGLPGKKVGDHQVAKPKPCPKHMSASEFAAHHSEVCAKFVYGSLVGASGPTIIVVTTLLDAKRYSARQLTGYGLRWQAAEVMRHLKTTLKWRC